VDALCLAFTTISTGGLLYTNESVMNMSIWVQVITMVFMFIGGVNFYLHFKAIVGKNPKAYTENKEFLYLITYFVVIATVIFLIYAAPKFGSAGFDLDAILTDYKNALFTVIALGTTTGASCFDFCEYPEIIMFILLIVMLIGASAGSTSGGIKIGRIRIMVRFFSNIFKNILHPNAVYDVKVDGESIDDSRVLSAVSITLLYIMTAFAAVVILLANGLNWTDSLGLAVATISNTGVGFGDFGPTGSFSVLSDGIKIFLMFLMWVGRLEISLALVFLTPTFWSDLFFTVHHRSRSKSIEKRK
jgi:trk system potassium uptake protein TrkH